MKIPFLRSPAELAAAPVATKPVAAPATPISSLPPPAPRAPVAQPAAKPAGMDSVEDLFESPGSTSTPPAKPEPAPQAKEPEKKEAAAEVEEVEETEDELDAVDGMIEGGEKPEAGAAKVEEVAKVPEESQKLEDKAPRTPKELRRTLRETNDRLFKTIRENAELRKQASTGSGPEVKAMSDQLAQVNERNKALEERLMGHDYKGSSEYKTKYEAPLNQAAQRAHALITQLEIASPDEDGGDPMVRPATWKDFQALAQLPPGKIDKAAHELFGHAAPRVIQHLDRIRELGEVADEAERTASTTVQQREQQRISEQAGKREIQLNAFRNTTQDLIKQYPDLFGESEDDPDGTDLIKKGLAWVEPYFSGKAADMDPAQRAKTDALIRLRAAGFGRVHHALKVTQKKLATALKEIEATKATRPKMTSGGATAPSGGESRSMVDGIDDIPLTSSM